MNVMIFIHNDGDALAWRELWDSHPLNTPSLFQLGITSPKWGIFRLGFLPCLRDGECFVGRWIATINSSCFSLSRLVLLSADQLPLAASGLPTGLDWQLLDSLQVSWLWKYLWADYCSLVLPILIIRRRIVSITMPRIAVRWRRIVFIWRWSVSIAIPRVVVFRSIAVLLSRSRNWIANTAGDNSCSR